MKAEIVPKNVLMIGPTGCGKTEMARRLARADRRPILQGRPLRSALLQRRSARAPGLPRAPFSLSVACRH